jgi:DNA-binding NarL/FixJ family response regulator
MTGNSGERAIRILIVDDHPVVRAGLTSMLSTQPGFVVAGSATNGVEALSLADSMAPDIILLDLRMPVMNGIEVLRVLQQKGATCRAIVLTSFETDEDIYQAVQAGSQGYLLKNSSQQELVGAIRAVYAGQRHLSPRITGRLAERMMRSAPTDRELEVLKMLLKGLTNQQIARALNISGNTARNHVNSIIEKLEVADRTEAVTVALRRGLVQLEQ